MSAANPSSAVSLLGHLVAEYLDEYGARSHVPVMNQVVDQFVADLSRLGQALGDVGARGGVAAAVSHFTDKDLPRVQVDGEEGVEGLQANGLDGEEVTGDDRRGAGLHELTPGLALWRGSVVWAPSAESASVALTLTWLWSNSSLTSTDIERSGVRAQQA